MKSEYKVLLLSKIKDFIINETKNDGISVDIGINENTLSKLSIKIDIIDEEKNDIVKLIDFKKIGINHNIIGMEFTDRGSKFKIVDVNVRNRKYPIIIKRTIGGKMLKAGKDYVIKCLGGENSINRYKNLEKILK